MMDPDNLKIQLLNFYTMVMSLRLQIIKLHYKINIRVCVYTYCCQISMTVYNAGDLSSRK